MATTKWTVQEEHLCKLLLPTNTHREIAEEINRRVDKGLRGSPASRSEDAVRRKCEREEWLPSTFEDYSEDSNPVATQWQTIEDIVEKYRENSVHNTRGVLDQESITTKILSLSDIHFPLVRIELLERALADHSDANIVVLNGDILEGYIFSTFDKFRTIAALDEYRCAFAFVEMLSKHFDKVVLTSGNHDVRSARALQQHGLQQDASQIFRPDLIARIARGERLDQTGALVEKLDFSNVHYEQSESWYVRIGKCIFVHPHGEGSSGPGLMVNKQAQRFNSRYGPGEIDCVVAGHSHMIYKGIVNNQLLIEQGCMAGLLSYSFAARNSYVNNGQNGYAVIYQDAQGNTDFNLSGPVYLGEIMPPKKSII